MRLQENFVHLSDMGGSAIEVNMYLPPDQPVLTSHAVALCFCIFSASMAAYCVGCSMINAAPKQAEKVALGSLTPTSVPATYNYQQLYNKPLFKESTSPA